MRPVDAYMLLQRLRRPEDQRDRRHAELGGLVLFPAPRLRMTADAPAAGRQSVCRASAPKEHWSPRRRRHASFSVPRRQDRRAGRRIRLRQERDRPDDHAPPAACRRASTAGAILFDGDDLAAASEPQMRRIRGDRIGMIFQEPMTEPQSDDAASATRSPRCCCLHRGLSRRCRPARGHRHAAQGRHRQPRASLRSSIRTSSRAACASG